MKRTFAIMLLTATLATGQLLAQEQAAPKQSHNSVYLEFGGNVPTWNIAFDRGIYNKDIRKIAVAIGFVSSSLSLRIQGKTIIVSHLKFII